MPPAMPNGTTREHDQRALEAAELEHEDRDDAEQRDDDRGLQAAEALGAAFELAARHVGVAARPLHLIEALRAHRSVTRSVL